MIPIAIYLATGPTIFNFELNALGVFEIFLFADLLAAATVAPVGIGADTGSIARRRLDPGKTANSVPSAITNPPIHSQRIIGRMNA